MFALCGLMLPLSARAAEETADPGITNRVRALLDAYAGADDLMDEQLLKKRAELEAMGERAFPALCASLKKKDDPIYQARIIEVFLRADGDSKEPLKAVREFLKTHRDSKYAPAHQAALKYLGAKGGEEDASILGEYLGVDDLVTKTIARKSKGMIERRVADRAHDAGGANDSPKETRK
jgi:hypothetical protein